MLAGMKKQAIIVIFAALVLLGLGWLAVEKRGSEQAVSDNTFNVASTTAALDYSKLTGKDRLYTEEEGRYENLSEEEKKIIRLSLSRSEEQQIEFDKMSYEEGNEIGRSFKREIEQDREEMIQNSSLVALKNEYALVSYPTVKAAHFYKLYDFKRLC